MIAQWRWRPVLRNVNGRPCCISPTLASKLTLLDSMLGPNILARSLSTPRVKDRHGNTWQYHPQSDRHSKIACWGILFDMLRRSALLRQHVADAKVGFGINHTMTDFTSGREKDLDLVISIPRSDDARDSALTLVELVDSFEIELLSSERKELLQLPLMQRRPVGDVLMALEAKACMTAHQRAGPRLYDELTSAWQCINGSAPQAIAVGYGIVNAAETFVSPKMNKRDLAVTESVVNKERQPKAAEGAQGRIRSVRVRGHTTERGFDAVGITTIIANNDGSEVTLAPIPPSLPASDGLHYERMILRIVGLYESRFLTR